MNHYERLGVARDATPALLRDAYRRAARLVHPDRTGDASSAAMAALNEAYRVLSDPELRRRYDAQLAGPAVTDAGRERAGEDTDDVADRVPDVDVFPPGRFPWRFLLVMGFLAALVVFVAAVVLDPPVEAPIDNVLRPGDCVVLTPTLEAAEAPCSGPHDATVHLLVPFDATCPTGSEAYRDRQGMGTACVIRIAASATTAT